jgi:hypothetical protein
MHWDKNQCSSTAVIRPVILKLIWQRVYGSQYQRLERASEVTSNDLRSDQGVHALSCVRYHFANPEIN